MKTNILAAAVILTGCVCAWGYLSAQSDGEKTIGEKAAPTTTLSLLEIREPTQEDFEHCAKRAVDFMESWSGNQDQTLIAMRELLTKENLSPQEILTSGFLTRVKTETEYGHPKLMLKKSLGEDIIILYYRYHTEGLQIFCQYTFGRNLDENGQPQQWRCINYNFVETPELLWYLPQ